MNIVAMGDVLDIDEAKPIGFRMKGIEKQFAGNMVLRGIDLTVSAGQFIAIVGRSGCGKSTFLRILVGLDRQTSGHITLDGTPGGDTGNARIVFQEPRLLPWMRVIDNVAVGLGSSVPPRAALRQAEMALDEVQLAEKADQWPARLSGGQRQRVALARALVSKPGLLALDEPLGALDALTRISMQRLLARVWHELGFTAVLVTHDVSEAVQLADRVIVLDKGHISLDLAVPHAHPRRHGDPELAALEARLLAVILGS